MPSPTSDVDAMASGGDPAFIYLDSSALVKLVLEESESRSLDEHLQVVDLRLASSSIARVEVMRAVTVAEPAPGTRLDAEALLDSLFLVAVTDEVLADAAALASARLRSLDAIQLASARAVRTVEFITYDERLADAARDQGLHVVQPGLIPVVGDHPRPRRDRRLHDRDV